MQNVPHLTIIGCRRRRLSPTDDGDTKSFLLAHFNVALTKHAVQAVKFPDRRNSKKSSEQNPISNFNCTYNKFPIQKLQK